MPTRQLPPDPLASALPSRLLAAAALLVLLTLCLWPSSKWRCRASNKTAPSSPTASRQPRRYSYDHLRRATASFSSANKLGQGGFGPVFRGSLPSGDAIAVKVMDSGSVQGEAEFRNELALASSMMVAGKKTPHVIFPVGFCSDDEEKHGSRRRGKPKKKKRRKRRKSKDSNWLDRMDAVDGDDGFSSSSSDDDVGARRRELMLVYELMPNGSLQDALLIRKRPELMEWRRRLSVALDIARGLSFLHADCCPPIVHGDIKPSNVLLDAHLSAKIADFGLARAIDHVAITVPVHVLESDAGDDLGASSAEVSPLRCPDAAEEPVDSAELTSNRSLSFREVLMEESRLPRQTSQGNCLSDSNSSSRRWALRGLEWWGSFDGRRRSVMGSRSKRRSSGKKNQDRGQDSSEILSWSRGSRRGYAASSTPTMRGTMFYAAPECGAESWVVSERRDVYSFGVLLLVIVSGRRPLQVTAASPMAEHANLIKWARLLSRKGKPLELVDRSVRNLNKEEAARCVAVALLCVQRDPEKRPPMKDVVEMLSGASEVPELPSELLPRTRGGGGRARARTGHGQRDGAEMA